jgi:hypothetical protein
LLKVLGVRDEWLQAIGSFEWRCGGEGASVETATYCTSFTSPQHRTLAMLVKAQPAAVCVEQQSAD